MQKVDVLRQQSFHALQILAKKIREDYVKSFSFFICVFIIGYNQKNPGTPILLGFRGFYSSEAWGIRTPDNLIKSQVLYRLS